MLLEGLRAEQAPVWQNVWTNYIVQRLANHAHRHIDFTQGVSLPGFAKIDDPITRGIWFHVDSIMLREYTDRLMESSSELNSIFTTRGVTRRSTKELRKLLLDGVVSELLSSPEANVILISVRGPEIWPALADRIARELHEEEVNSAEIPEWLLWNKLLLSRFFQGCLLDLAQQVAAQMESFRGGLHGPRSYLLAIGERVGRKGLLDICPQWRHTPPSSE